MEIIRIKTKKLCEMIDITKEVKELVRTANTTEGLCVIFVPHTTAAITLNENADDDVQRDIIKELDEMVPYYDDYLHNEGNSAAHIKASLVGSSATVIIHKGELQLGTWQGIYLCEFDGPRDREVYVKIL